MKHRIGDGIFLFVLQCGIVLEVAGCVIILLCSLHQADVADYTVKDEQEDAIQISDSLSVTSDNCIKWVDFNVSVEALSKAYEYDVDTYKEPVHLNWIELLAYGAARSGGTFQKKTLEYIDEAAEKLEGKKQSAHQENIRDAKEENTVSMETLTKELEYYPYYLEAYQAVLSGFVGEYKLGENTEGDNATQYGLKAFSPIAKGFSYDDYDDFGASRSYGYQRNHLGHDMMGQIGTPIIAVESGTVEALGWNQYGGWRIGIRSHDKKRYYYYAHLRQNYPYAEGLEEGDELVAGDVIGYMGHTGYSTTENVNNIDTVHLHFGMQLIFDESQKESTNEIWIDCYNLVRFLEKNRSEVEKDGETREWRRRYKMIEMVP